jgi:hypothetical protein
MNNKEAIEYLSKLIDSLYKKLLVLLAIAGGFGAYSISFLKEGNSLGYAFLIVFGWSSVAILIAYLKLSENIKKLEDING